MVTNAECKSRIDLGKNIVLIGLLIQIASFAVFILIMAIFHYRISQYPTMVSLESILPWQGFIMIIYVVSFLIMGRSVFRVVEFAVGGESRLNTSETFLYVLDAGPMLSCAYFFNGSHPSTVLQKKRYKDSADHVELLAK